MNRGIEKLLSHRLVIGFPEQRLTYLADSIVEKRAEYCVVLEQKRQRFLGMFRIADVAAIQPAQSKILLDLVAQDKFPVVPPYIAVELILDKLVEGEKGVVAVVDHEDEFVGLVTLESYSLWVMREQLKRTRAGRHESENKANVFPFESPSPEDRRRDA